MKAITVNNLSKYFIPSKRAKKKMILRGVSKDRIGKILAVDGVSFEVEKGEIFGFLGPNGAGKTTTIRMLTGVLEPNNGKINIFGINMWKNPMPIKHITGNVPELASIYPDLTGAQNINFIGQLYGIKKNIRLERIEKLLKMFDLYEKRDLKAKGYSKGMKQRLLLCMALINNPKILFLDEPLSGLDVQSSQLIKQIIKNYNKQGATIFLTTHDMNVANELCDRIAIINKGKITHLETPEKLKKVFQENHAIEVAFNQDVSIEKLKNLNFVKEVNKNRIGFVLVVQDLNGAICEIIDFVRSNSFELKKLNTLEPSLTDVFLKIIERGDNH